MYTYIYLFIIFHILDPYIFIRYIHIEFYKFSFNFVTLNIERNIHIVFK